MKKNLIFYFLLLLTVATSAQYKTQLTPLPVGSEIQKLDLAGQWRFHPSPNENFRQGEQIADWDLIDVPGQWVMQGYEVEKGKMAGYVRKVFIPAAWNGKRVKIRCNGIFSESRLFVNGAVAGSHLGGFTPFEFDITSLINTGKENILAIEVASESIADSTANASRYAVHPLGGITRDLYLLALPETNLSLFHVSTTFDSDYTDAVLTADVEIRNEKPEQSKPLTLNFILTDASGKEVEIGESRRFPEQIDPESRKELKFEFHVAKPAHWDSEHPYLYTFTCQLRDGDNVLHTTSRRIGFRQVEVRGNQLFVNNKPVKLRGVCRHEVMPLRGRSLIGDIWQKDVELFRRANVNYIRTSHYPPDEALLDACDELGMFVEEEAPFCWAHEAKVSGEQHDAVLVNQHVEMVNRDRSHPSVIIWSLGNESNLYTEYFKKAAEVVKEMDPTRPRIFSQWSPDADNGELEIGNHHYPGPTGPDTYRNSKRPIVFDEFCHLNAYNRLELAADPGLRYMWGRLLDAMWTKMYYSKGVLGGAIWAGIDDTFFLPGGITVGYGTWGPLDGWRREKPEYWEMKKAYSPVRITLKGNMKTQGLLSFDVENRHNFTNLSECNIQWKAGNGDGVVKVDVAPHQRGAFEIELPEILRESKEIELTINSPLGFVIDEYKFQILPERIEAETEKKQKISVIERDDAMCIVTSGGQLTVSMRDGLVSLSRGENDVLLPGSPCLMLLPLNPEGDGIQMTGKGQAFEPYTPVCRDWICELIEKKQTDAGVEIRVKGRYREAEGLFTYFVSNNGKIEIAYDFTVLQHISPRQTGIVFTLPASFDHLKWKRQGYWNVYPADQIGALEGEAKALDPNLSLSGIAGPAMEPAVDWGSDQTANGSNRFRSTKENIREVSLTAPDGCRLTVLSDGKQHARAWKDGNFSRLLIAGYNNPGNERFLVSHAQTEYKPLRPGDKVKGTITIKL